MRKEKIAELVVYQRKLLDRAEAPVPPKHEGHPNEFRAFLANELRIVTKQIEDAKLEGPTK